MKLVRLLFKISAALFVSLSLWEVLLRLTILTPIPFQHNPRLGWMPAPHSKGIAALEGRGYVTFNELGFRDDKITPPRPNETRILCMGDSYTVGSQMNADKIYPQHLQTLLREAGTPNVRVFNAGREGTTIAFSVGLADEYRKIFQPDWTIVQIRDGWSENFNHEQEIHFLADGDSFRTETQWHWDTMSPRMKQLIRWHIRDIALFQYGNRHLSELRRGGADDDAPQAAPLKLAPDQSRLESGYISGDREKRAIAWTVAELKAKYPRLILLHIPYGSPAHLNLVPLESEEATLIAECRRQNVPLISMREAFARDAELSQRAPIGFSNTLPWMGHPNARAHNLIAHALANYLMPRLAPQHLITR
jgi:hypothetical protein